MTLPVPSLVAAFRNLTPAQKDNLRYHLRKRTPIVCSATVWTDGKGGG